MNQPTTQTLTTFLICPCGAKADIAYGFPGQPERGLCDLHKDSIAMSREMSPGRAEVASVRRLDVPPVEVRQVAVVSTTIEAPDSAARELNWTKSQLEDEREEHAETKAQLKEALERLAEAHAAAQSTVDGAPQT